MQNYLLVTAAQHKNAECENGFWKTEYVHVDNY